MKLIIELISLYFEIIFIFFNKLNFFFLNNKIKYFFIDRNNLFDDQNAEFLNIYINYNNNET